MLLIEPNTLSPQFKEIFLQFNSLVRFCVLSGFEFLQLEHCRIFYNQHNIRVILNISKFGKILMSTLFLFLVLKSSLFFNFAPLHPQKHSVINHHFLSIIIFLRRTIPIPFPDNFLAHCTFSYHYWTQINNINFCLILNWIFFSQSQ